MRRAFVIAFVFVLGPSNAYSECPLNSVECNGVITTRDYSYFDPLFGRWTSGR